MAKKVAKRSECKSPICKVGQSAIVKKKEACVAKKRVAKKRVAKKPGKASKKRQKGAEAFLKGAKQAAAKACKQKKVAKRGRSKASKPNKSKPQGKVKLPKKGNATRSKSRSSRSKSRSLRSRSSRSRSRSLRSRSASRCLRPSSRSQSTSTTSISTDSRSASVSPTRWPSPSKPGLKKPAGNRGRSPSVKVCKPNNRQNRAIGKKKNQQKNTPKNSPKKQKASPGPLAAHQANSPPQGYYIANPDKFKPVIEGNRKKTTYDMVMAAIQFGLAENIVTRNGQFLALNSPGQGSPKGRAPPKLNAKGRKGWSKPKMRSRSKTRASRFASRPRFRGYARSRSSSSSKSRSRSRSRSRIQPRAGGARVKRERSSTRSRSSSRGGPRPGFSVIFNKQNKVPGKFQFNMTYDTNLND